MAAGDIFTFNQYEHDKGNGVHILSTATLKMGFIDSVITPTIDDVLPAWDVSSSVDYDGNEVAGTSGNYPAGGYILTGVTWVVDQANDHTVLDSDNITIATAAGNPTDARWGILYNFSATSNEAIGFLDLGAPIDMTAGDFTFTVPATGWTRVGLGTLT